MKTVVIKSADGCSRCVGIKNNLKSSKIPFREINLSRDEEALNKTREEFGGKSILVPIVSYGGETYDSSNMAQILRLIKKAKLDFKKEEMKVS